MNVLVDSSVWIAYFRGSGLSGLGGLSGLDGLAGPAGPVGPDGPVGTDGHDDHDVFSQGGFLPGADKGR